MQGCGSRSAWILIPFPSWIRIQEITIENNSRKNARKIGNNCNFRKMFIVNFDRLHGFFTFVFLSVQLKKTLNSDTVM